MRGYRRHGTNMPGGAVGPVSVQHLGSGAADAQGTIMPGGVVGSPVFSVLAICGSSCGPSECHGCGCLKGHCGARRGCKAVAVARGLRYWVVDPHRVCDGGSRWVGLQVVAAVTVAGTVSCHSVLQQGQRLSTPTECSVVQGGQRSGRSLWHRPHCRGLW